jgi:hypothetical protein
MRVGPYSVVWFDAVATDAVEHVSGYVAKEGQLLEASCARGAVEARPYGANSEYPPPEGGAPPESLRVNFDLGREGVLVINVTTLDVLVDVPTYQRMTGRAVGGLGLWDRSRPSRALRCMKRLVTERG